MPGSQEGNRVKNLLSQRYKMTDLGVAQRFLGIEINCTSQGISLGQTGYIDIVLRQFGLEKAHDVKSPMDPDVRLDNITCEDKKADKNHYLSIVGSLMYAALATRPDISFYVTTLSRYNNTPLQMHLTAAKQVLRYLKHTRCYKLHYTQGQSRPLTGFTDSDWAGRVATRKLVGGCIFFGSYSPGNQSSGPICWQVHTQSVGALSTLEAEYIACLDTTREALWLRQLEASILMATDIAITPQMIPIGVDNQGALKVIKSGVLKQKTKHIAVKYHHSHDEDQKGTVHFYYVHTTNNVTDLLTKALCGPRHQHLTLLIGLHDNIRGQDNGQSMDGLEEEEGVLK